MFAEQFLIRSSAVGVARARPPDRVVVAGAHRPCQAGQCVLNYESLVEEEEEEEEEEGIAPRRFCY